MEALVNKLAQLHPINAQLSDAILSLARVEEFNAGDFILKEGQVCKKAGLIAKGLVRSYYITDGKDITSRIMEEGLVITSWPSYYMQQPSSEFIEAIEPTQLICLYYDAIQKLYQDYPEFNIIGRKQTEYAFYLSEQRTQMLRKHTAEEKYSLFLQHHHNIMQRVSLKHIATYLGMNEETLSRVRSRFHKAH